MSVHGALLQSVAARSRRGRAPLSWPPH